MKFDYVKRIKELQALRNWTNYRLSEESGVSQTTLKRLAEGDSVKLSTLERICDAFGITLSQFFREGQEAVELTEQQATMLDLWNTLSSYQKEALLNTLKSYSD